MATNSSGKNDFTLSGEQVTPSAVYAIRRHWLRWTAAASALALVRTVPAVAAQPVGAAPGELPPLASVPSQVAGARAADDLTAYEHVTQYNNF